jgi:uncharacterized protein YjiS (DUF1127 family)
VTDCDARNVGDATVGGRSAPRLVFADPVIKAQFCAARHIGHRPIRVSLWMFLQVLKVAMSKIRRRARGTTTWLIRAGSGNDLTTLSDRDLRDLGLVRQQIGINTCKLFWFV